MGDFAPNRVAEGPPMLLGGLPREGSQGSYFDGSTSTAQKLPAN